MIEILSLAWPTILEFLLSTVLQYIDTAMVGHLGASATATVSLSSTYTWLINSVMSAAGVGFLSYIARAVGQKDRKKIQAAASQTILVSLVIGVVLMGTALLIAPSMPVWMGAEEGIRRDASLYFTYINMPMIFRAATIIFGSAIRATGDTKTPMVVNVVVNFLNIGMNYVFIYVLGRGAVGAGISTGISYTIGGVWMTLVLFKNKTLQVEWKQIRPNAKILNAILAVGFPILLTRVASTSGYVVFTSFISSMATTIYAAHAIAITAEELFYIPGYGMQAATATLIGNAIGEGNVKKQKDVKIQSILMVFVMMCVTGLLLYLGAEFMMHLFTQDEEVIVIGAKLLRMVAFTEPVFGSAAVMEGIYNGMGRTKYPLFVELVSMWGVRILGSFICVRVLGLGIISVWVMMICNNVLKAILLAVGLFVIGKQKKDVL